MYKLKIISSTVRPGRKGPLVAKWIMDKVNAHGGFEAEILDLGEINLPMMNEPAHPMLRQYEHQHTKDWSAKIEEADAFIFVTAEYDYSYPAPLKNALEYLVHEWAFKPAGIVSYSLGTYAGVRAMANLKTDLLSMRVVSIHESVNIATLGLLVDDNGVFKGSEPLDKSARIQLDQLLRWTKGMKLIREDKVS